MQQTSSSYCTSAGLRFATHVLALKAKRTHTRLSIIKIIMQIQSLLHRVFLGGVFWQGQNIFFTNSILVPEAKPSCMREANDTHKSCFTLENTKMTWEPKVK